MISPRHDNNSSSFPAKDSFASPPTTRYCCFVIPSRLALFGFSVIIFLFGAGFGAVGWVIANKLDKQLLEIERLALFFHILIYFLLVIFATIGIYGVVQKAARYTSLFASMILGQFVFNVASGALCLYLLFRNGPNGDPTLGGYRQCMDVVVAHPNDFFLRNLCEQTPLMKGLSVGLYVFMWLTEIIAAMVSNQYSSQLHEEAAQMEMLNPRPRESFYC
ncbi:hypothetical protein P691DRAFT_666579 [Macrolepiota fuliginosa MF-IS2]|uniref:Uncharacterized protein n=1 Tax=Macrolepiota fuliginosa MF-IS2 TaxID=1400762 RepID=A0A9P5XIK8_9AGAR|nr:hypothetical protein P691DRAFT_666579 [Macrolepiota fuliginosa MF-IS2]